MADKELEIKIRARVDADGMTRLERAIKRIREETREYKDDQTRLNRVLHNAEKVFQETRNKSISLKKQFKELREAADPEAKEALQKLSKQIGIAEDRERDAIDATRKVIKALHDLGVESEEEKAKLKDLNDELYKSESFLKGMKPAARKSARALKDMSKELKENAKQGKEANKQLSKIDKSLNGLVSSIKRGAKERIGELLVEGPLQLIEEVGERVITFLQDSSQAYRQFDQDVRSSYTLIANQSTLVKDTLGRNVLALGTEIGRTTDETLPALYQALTLGVPEDNVIDYIRTASKAANAGNAELAQTLTTGLGIVNAYGEDVITLSEVYDQLFFLIQRGSLTMDDINANMNKVTSVAGEAKVPLQDITSALIVMTRQGDSFEEAAELLSLMLTQLSISGTQLGSTFKKVAGEDFRTFIQKGGSLAEALELLQIYAADTKQSMADILGGDSPFYRDTQAARGALELTGKNMNNFIETTKLAEQAVGEMEKANEEVEDSYFKLANSSDAATERLKVSTGERLSQVTANLKKWNIVLSTAIADSVDAENANKRFEASLEELGLTWIGVANMVSGVNYVLDENNQIIEAGEDRLERQRIALELVKNGYLNHLEPGREASDQIREMITLRLNEEKRLKAMSDAYAKNTQLLRQWSTHNRASAEAQGYLEGTIRGGTTAVRFQTTELEEQNRQLAINRRLVIRDVDESELRRLLIWDRQREQIEKNTQALFDFNTEFGTSNRFVESGTRLIKEYYDTIEQEAEEAARIMKGVVTVFFDQDTEGLFGALDEAREQLGSITNDLSHEEEVLRIQEANQAIVDSYQETALKILEAKAMEDPARLERILAIEVELGAITEAQAQERLEYAHTIVAIQDMTASVVENQRKTTAAANAIKVASGDYSPYREAIGAVNREIGAMIKGMDNIDGRRTTSFHTHTTTYQEQGPRPPASASGATSGTQTGLERNTPLGFSTGGWVPSWLGIEGQDSVPAWLMPRERVLSHQEIRNMGGAHAVDNLARGEASTQQTTINNYYNMVMESNVYTNGGIHAVQELLRQESRRQLINAAKAREVDDALSRRNLFARKR